MFKTQNLLRERGLIMITAEVCKNVIRERLSDARYHHSINVAESAVALAEKYGADVKKAEISGLLHDVTKEMAFKEQKKFMDEYEVELSPVESSAPKLWHAISGAIFAKYILKIDDDDIIRAIRRHTTGAENMTILEKVVYVADFISSERVYPGVKKMRHFARHNLDLCVLEGLKFSLKDLSNRNFLIHPDTLNGYNFMVSKKNM